MNLFLIFGGLILIKKGEAD